MNTCKVLGQVLPDVRSANVTPVLGGGFGCGHLAVKNSEPPDSGLGWGPRRDPLLPSTPLLPSGKGGWGSARLTELVTDNDNMEGIIIMLGEGFSHTCGCQVPPSALRGIDLPSF